LILFGAGAALVVGVWLVLLQDGGLDLSAPVTPPTDVSPTPRETPPPDGGIPVPPDRDPFNPLIVVPTTTGGGVSPTSPFPTSPFPTSPFPTSPFPTSPVPTTPTVSPPGSPGPTPSGGTAIQIGGHVVVLLGVFVQDGIPWAQVDVDGTVYTVGEGQTFDDGFALIDVNGRCASFAFQTQLFTLCEQAPK
jgi:hypothetical protein